MALWSTALCGAVSSIGFLINGLSRHASIEQRRRGDSARFLGEFPERVVNPAQVLVREAQRLAVIESELDQPAGHNELQLWASLAATARDDVHEHDQGDDSHRSDSDDRHRGHAEDHVSTPFRWLARETLEAPVFRQRPLVGIGETGRGA